jgi:hypothetical protein
MAPAIIGHINFVARLSRCWREVNNASVFRVTFLGTKIVVCVHLVHPLRQVFGFSNKLTCTYMWLFSGVLIAKARSFESWCKVTRLPPRDARVRAKSVQRKDCLR